MPEQQSIQQLTAREIYGLAYAACHEGADSRPVLGCVLIDEGRLIAADGFRMHIIHHAPTWDDWAAIHYRRFAGHDIPPDPPSPDLWPCVYPFIDWVAPGCRYPNHKAVTDHPVHAVAEMPLTDVLEAIRHSHTLGNNVPFVDIPFDGYPEKAIDRWNSRAFAVGNIARLQPEFLGDALKYHHRFGRLADIVYFEALSADYAGGGAIRIVTFGMTAYIMPMHIPVKQTDRA